MFEKLCRLCASLKDDLVDIFDGSSTMNRIQWQIYNILFIRIQPDDVLPTGICSSCLSNLERTIDFITYCHSVQKTLKEQYEAYIVSNNVQSYGLSPKHASSAVESNFSSMSYSYDELLNERGSATVVDGNGYMSECLPSCQSKIDSNVNSNSHNLSNFQRILSSRPTDESPSKLDVGLEEKSANFSYDGQFTIRAPDLLECSLGSDNSPVLNQNYPKTDANFKFNDDRDKNVEHLEKVGQLSSSSSEVPFCNTRDDSQRKSKDVEHFFTVEMTDSASRKDKEKLTCEVCSLTFSQKLAYEEHLNVHTGNRPFVCNICDATFRKRQELKQHLRTIHSEKQFKCSLCSYIAKHKGKLTEHVKSIHEKPFKCSMCSYRTGEKGKIVQHIANKHTTVLSFVCEICGSGFKTKTSLQTHQQNIHFPQPKVCQTCGILCPSLSKYSAHIFRCGKDKQRYSCEVCGQTYVNKEILKDHMNKHLNLKPYKCDVCGKEFFQRNRLDTHKYVHRGPSYHCQVCNQSFNRKDNMKNHIKKHFYKSVTCENTIVTAV